MSKNASALASSLWLQKVYTIYSQFGLKKEADEIAIHIQNVGKKSKDEMKTISAEIKIPNKKLEEYIIAITEGNFEEVSNKIAFHFIPKKGEIVQQVNKLSTKAPLSFLVMTNIQDRKGRIIAQIGPLHEDLDGHVVYQMSKNMFISSVFLRLAIEKLLVKFDLSVNKIIDSLYISPLFCIEKKPIIELGLKAYLENNPIVAAHLLIPQIEDNLRNLVEQTGGSVYKPNRVGGFSLKNLDEILRDDIVVEILGEEVIFYLRVLLTDQRGWNLRNSVCHGISPANSFNSVIADRIFHVLILLGQLRNSN